MENIRPIIEQRIKTQVTDFREVAGASDLQSIISGRITAPGAYVFRDKIRPDQSASIQSTVQQVFLDYAVVIVVSNLRDGRGSDADDISHSLQDDIRAALLGWSAYSGFTPFTFNNGDLISFAGGLHIWRDIYTTSTFIKG